MATVYQVLTAVGPDRPGIIKEISATLHACGCNLEDSRMALLAGKFALVLLFSGSVDNVALFSRQRQALAEKLGFQLQLTDTERGAPDRSQERVYLAVTGVDQPGIVHRVTEVLANHHVNVVVMDSRLTHAAFTGTAIFSLRAELVLPTPAVLQAIRNELVAVGEQLNLTVSLQNQQSPDDPSEI